MLLPFPAEQDSHVVGGDGRAPRPEPGVHASTTGPQQQGKPWDCSPLRAGGRPTARNGCQVVSEERETGMKTNRGGQEHSVDVSLFLQR